VKVLLDENLPHKLCLHLPEHDVVTVAFAGLDGLKNGKLMKAAEDAGFDVFVTADRALPYQQNMAARRIAVVALSGQNLVCYPDSRRADLPSHFNGSTRYGYPCELRRLFAQAEEQRHLSRSEVANATACAL
jgi:hypothetical protein